MSNNDPQQQQMIRDAMKAIAERKPGRTKLVYDKTKRTIVAVADGSQPPRALNITAEDADMFAVMTLSSRWLREQWPQITRDRMVSVLFSSWDDGDALTQCCLGVQPSPSVVQGTILLGEGTAPPDGTQLRVVLTAMEASGSDPSTFTAPDGVAHRAVAWRTLNNAEQAVTPVFADVQPELNIRRASILETTVLSDKSVLCIGLGTGGAQAAIELAKCGVGRFTLVDRDRLSVGNVVRHPGGISQVGRFKVNVVRDLIHEKNPDAQVMTHPIELTYENRETLKQLIAQASVVICGTDNRPSKLLVNQLCVEANVVAVYGGAFRRAYGGQILRVRPKQSPCHECFVTAMPDEASDVEISSASDAGDIAYSDRPVAVEPGLSLDVLPIAMMLAKLALLELLADKASSLSVLNRDFDAPWYLWLNRPEPGTQYASWPPLSASIDEMTINRWYGIYFDRETGCPVCGDFISTIAGSYGIDVSSLGPLRSSPTKE
ncbi:MAG TPA: ThiF family adenylyltransferase [Terriglobia bacterium]|nr:ThiF family adenylyltransferase [Terriglobia bacterium]